MKRENFIWYWRRSGLKNPDKPKIFIKKNVKNHLNPQFYPVLAKIRINRGLVYLKVAEFRCDRTHNDAMSKVKIHVLLLSHGWLRGDWLLTGITFCALMDLISVFWVTRYSCSYFYDDTVEAINFVPKYDYQIWSMGTPLPDMQWSLE